MTSSSLKNINASISDKIDDSNSIGNEDNTSLANRANACLALDRQGVPKDGITFISCDDFLNEKNHISQQKFLIKNKESLSPMLQQYLGEKEKYPDCLLFFRLGDFYEMFFEDAITAAKALHITLTQRGLHENTPIPMCGVPFHAAENYIKKLLEQGFRIAICEQVETPEDRKEALRHHKENHDQNNEDSKKNTLKMTKALKGPLRREVVRIITPGTVIEDIFLESKAHNFLLSVAHHKKSGKLSCALLDLSTRTFLLEEVAQDDLFTLLSHYQVSEILIPDHLFETHFEKLRPYHRCLKALPPLKYDVLNAKDRLHKMYNVATFEGVEKLSDTDYTALAVLIDYVELTQKQALSHLPFPKKQANEHFLILDHYTRANLEIHQSIRGTRDGSLIDAIDYTVTSGGARLLQNRLSFPLRDHDELNRRLDTITFLKDNSSLCDQLRSILTHNYDLARALSRLIMEKGGPRDLGHVAGSLKTSLLVMEALSTFTNCPFICPIVPKELLTTLEKALKDVLPLLTRDGGFIQDGFYGPLDELYTLQNNTEQHLNALQDHYRETTGITTLKIKTNNILGYFLECPPSQGHKIPDSFIHRQSLASALRYTTPELNTLAHKITSAAFEAIDIEIQLFKELCDLTLCHQDTLKQIADFLAMMDVTASMAHLATIKNYTRPLLKEDATLTITQGRHPVLDAKTFIPNDVVFDEKKYFFLVTGPNMAGKSTYLRQVALITLMTQCGFYVPAKKAEIGLVDRIFSRIGAGDDLASGRSTFMVEMVETATILNQATSRSLVILDELGRGTSTYDGLSLAWAVTEYLSTLCRTLFATHYFELTHLEQSLSTLSNVRMSIKEYDGKILFLHKVEHGAASRSYGLHVAALSGVPKAIIQRAEKVLENLHMQNVPVNSSSQQLTLPIALPSKTSSPESVTNMHVNNHSIANKSMIEKRDGLEEKTDQCTKKIIEAIQQCDPCHLTPLQALTLLSELKNEIRKSQ